jgi:hypothetical protein
MESRIADADLLGFDLAEVIRPMASPVQDAD